MAKTRTIPTTLIQALAFWLLLIGGADATTKTIWSLFFSTPWSPCGDGVLITQGGAAGPGIRPCSFYQPTYPWDQCQPITVIGYDLVHQVTDQKQSTWLVIGSGHGGDGADVFAMTGGIGSTSKGMMFPPGTGLKQGALAPGNPTGVHIDVYGSCGSGSQRALVSIYYTSP